MLPRGEILRGGDLVTRLRRARDRSRRRSRRSCCTSSATPQALAQAAYHLGNRHVPVQVGDGFLRIAEDHVLEEMLKKLGAKVSRDARRRSSPRRAPTPAATTSTTRWGMAGRSTTIHARSRATTMSRRALRHDHDHAHMSLRAAAAGQPALPVGAYSYSRAGIGGRGRHRARRRERASAGSATCSSYSVARMEAPVLLRLMTRGETDSPRCDSWNEMFLASRETAELRAETRADGLFAATGCCNGPAASRRSCRVRGAVVSRGVRVRRARTGSIAPRRRAAWPISGPGWRTR